MKTWTESRVVLQSRPFQLQIADGFQWGLVDGTADSFYTFRARLTRSFTGIEGEFQLLLSNEWSDIDLFFSSIPGQQEGEELVLFFLPINEINREAIIAKWQTGTGNLPFFCVGDGSSEELSDSWKIIRNVISTRFPLREITDPATQIPGYKPEHHSVLFGE